MQNSQLNQRLDHRAERGLHSEKPGVFHQLNCGDISDTILSILLYFSQKGKVIHRWSLPVSFVSLGNSLFSPLFFSSNKVQLIYNIQRYNYTNISQTVPLQSSDLLVLRLVFHQSCSVTRVSKYSDVPFRECAVPQPCLKDLYLYHSLIHVINSY